MMSSEEALKQLDSALALMKQASSILDAVQAGWSVPDAPERAPLIDRLSSIQAQAAHATQVADRLITTLK
jgi:hypothetical protein